MNYQLMKTTDADADAQSSYVLMLVDGKPVLTIPPDPANSDYAAYLQWLEAGNTPEPAPEPEPTPEPTPAEKLAAAGLTVDDLKALLGL